MQCCRHDFGDQGIYHYRAVAHLWSIHVLGQALEIMNWARFHANGYEVSSQGDTRFSALFAVLPDGRTIEEAYQLDVKGYRVISDNWRDGKGNKAYNNKSRAELWAEYLELWREWVIDTPIMFYDLRQRSKGKVLTDKFATSDINQAHALAVLISEQETQERLPFTF